VPKLITELEMPDDVAAWRTAEEIIFFPCSNEAALCLKIGTIKPPNFGDYFHQEFSQLVK
jgi:hypothetical protein